MQHKIWNPPEKYIQHSEIQKYIYFLKETFSLNFTTYQDLWKWSIHNIEDFWKSQLQYHPLLYSGEYENVLTNKSTYFIGNEWFGGIELNYAEHIFENKRREDIAVIYKNEKNKTAYISWQELIYKTAYFRTFLLEKNIQKGDRVAGILNNSPQTLALFLAVNSLGAVWSCCSPDFGQQSIADRFRQIEPKLLFAEGAYQYNGKKFDLRDSAWKVANTLDSVESTVIFEEAFFDRIKEEEVKPLQFERVPFSHPIWILFSSGTTGKPKAITHGVGGILLEHFKALALHQNVQKGDLFLWYSTTGWMMWNYAVSSLLCGATLVLYDESLHYPDSNVLWRFCQETEISHVGLGASFLSQYPPEGIKGYQPKTLGSTGSPLAPHSFIELQKIFPQTHIISLSGGTDVCSAFISGCAWLPVYAGELQCRTLGSDIIAADERGKPLKNEIGELVIRQVMPSMPLYFWNDKDNRRYKESYFEKYEGVWCHGDWIKITENNGIIIYGRSDSTLNRGGVRIGTAEIYNILEKHRAVQDSLVLTMENKSGKSEMFLFVQIKDTYTFDEKLMKQIKQTLRTQGSPRHVPDFIYEVPDIPCTLSGKKMEIPVKRILTGTPLEDAVSLEVVKNPESFDYWVDFRAKSE